MSVRRALSVALVVGLTLALAPRAAEAEGEPECEAWDVDYFLHENPELKRFAFAWMTELWRYEAAPDWLKAVVDAERPEWARR